MTEQALEPVEVYYGKNLPDLQRVKKAYTDLMGDRTHAATCACPSCLYHLHKTKGGRFDKKVFFLDWLSLEVKLSLINQTEKIVFENAYDRGKKTMSVEWKDFFRTWGTIRALARFVGDNFPDINMSPRRIKLKLWRFRKSGIHLSLQKEIDLNGMRANPVDPKMNKTWGPLAFGQKVADYIYKHQDRIVTQRDLRRFFQKPVEELVNLRPWLGFNYGIYWKLGSRKNQTIYFGTRKNSRGQFLGVGIHDAKRIGS